MQCLALRVVEWRPSSSGDEIAVLNRLLLIRFVLRILDPEGDDLVFELEIASRGSLNKRGWWNVRRRTYATTE